MKQENTILMTLLVALTFFVSSASGWYTWSEDYQKCYIAGVVPDQHFEPSGIDSHEDGISASLPLTVRVHTRQNLYEIEKVKLQWKEEGSSTWTDIDPTYQDTDKNFEFDWNQIWFGQTTITSDDVSAGTSILIRVYISNLTNGYQNASMGVDTDEEGTNGWEDPWVMKVNLRADERPPMPG